MHHSATFSHIDSSFHFIILYLITCARYPTLRRMMTFELARPLLKKSSCAACIMCRALVFHLDPAAPAPASAVVDLSSPLITAPLLTPHPSQLHCSSQLITAPLLTGPLLITTHHNLSHPNSSQLHFSHLTHHSSTAHPNSSQLHFWQVHFSSQLITTYHIPTHHSSTSHTSLITAPLLITTHHSSTSDRSTSHHNSSHPNSSQLHFWQVHFSSQFITTYHIPTHHSSTSHTSLLTAPLSHHNFSLQLITAYPITAPLLTPLLTPHLSHQNSSQRHFSHLTSQVHFSHLTSHTSPKFTLKYYIHKGLTCGVVRSFYYFFFWPKWLGMR